MRIRGVAFLTLTISVRAFGATPPSTDRAPAAPDPQLVEARVGKTVDWYRLNLRKAYESGGSRNEKWDAAAIAALDAVADLWSRNPQRAGNEQERAWSSSKKAVAAGCDDPLLLFVQAIGYEEIAFENAEEALRLKRKAASAIDSTKYSAAIKARVHLGTVEAMIAAAVARRADRVPGAQEQFASVRELLAEMAKSTDVPHLFLVDLVGGLLDAERRLGADRQEGYDTIAAIFTKERAAKDVILPLLQARFQIDYGWDARGGAPAGALTGNMSKVFLSRIADADRSLARAIALDPLSPAIAPQMLIVELAEGRGRERMESWFRYGVAVDPGNEDLHRAKLHYLEPRWHGSPQESIDFGREALAGKQWAQRKPLALAIAHAHLASYLEDGVYFREYPQACDDMRAVYNPYLERYPDATLDRSTFALVLYYCGDFAAADRQFKTLGKDGRILPFLGRANYENKRLDAAARATAKRP